MLVIDNVQGLEEIFVEILLEPFGEVLESLSQFSPEPPDAYSEL